MSTRLISPLAVALIAWGLPASLCRAADLYVLSIGVEPTWTFKGEHDLYAGDAVFVGEAFSKSEGLYAHTHRRVVSGKQATREGVLDGLAWLGKSFGESDLAIIFFSTHGIGESEKGHEVTLYDAGGKYSALMSTEIWAALDAAKGRTVVLMDSCTSGGMIPPASQLEKRKKRTAFFAGCTATEETGGQFQRADRPHGWFVIALCEALAGKADTDGDGVVTLGEVEKYLPGRARQFYPAQNAFLVGSKEMRKLPLVRVDPAHPAVELFTAQKKELGYDPSDETDHSPPLPVPPDNLKSKAHP